LVRGTRHTLRLWDGNTGKEMAALADRAQPSIKFAFSADSTRIVAGSMSIHRELKLWNGDTGDPIEVTFGQAHKDDVTACQFSPDGETILSGSKDGTVKLWNPLSGQELLSISHDEGITACSFSPDGRNIIVASQTRRGFDEVWFATDYSRVFDEANLEPAQKSIIMWDLNNREKWFSVPGNVFAFSPDGAKLAYVSTGFLVLFDMVTRREMKRLRLKCDVLSCAFSPDSARILCATEEGYLELWNTVSGNAVRLAGQRGKVRACAFSGDGHWIASITSAQLLELSDARGETGLCRFWLESAGTALGWSPNSRDIVVGNEMGSLLLVRLENIKSFA